MTRRADGTQGGPEGLDVSFPAIRPRRRIWFRAHRYRADAADAGCWHYSSLPAPIGGGGRFDLPSPRGTCYIAESALAAAREALGRPGDVIAHDEVDGRVISALRVAPGRLADLLHPDAARRGVTRELSTSTPYPLTQAWAKEFADLGFHGISYQARFSSEPAISVAVFGDARRPQSAPPVVSTRPLADVLRAAGYKVASAPSLRDIGPLLD